MQRVLVWLALWSLFAGSANAAVSFEPVAMVNQPAVGTAAGVTYAGFFAPGPRVHADGEVVFSAYLNGTTSGSNIGIWRGAAGGAVKLVQMGDPAPGAAGGVSFSLPGSGDLNVNGAGILIFNPDLQGSITAETNSGVWAGSSSASLVKVLQEGDPAPGLPGVSFGYASRRWINDGGQMVIRSALAGAVNSTNNEAIWVGNSGSTVAVLARKGSVAPGTSSAFVGLGSPAISNGGRVAFNASLHDAASDLGIWSGTAAGNLSKLMRTGEAAPGAGGASFAGPVSDPRINSVGRIAFLSGLAGGGVTATDDRAIFAGSSAADLQLIVREGQTAPGLPAGWTFGTIAGGPLHSGDRLVFQPDLRSSSGVTSRSIWTSTSATDLTLVAKQDDPVPGLDADFFAFDRLNANSAGQIAFTAQFSGPGLDNSNNTGLFFYSPGQGLALLARRGDFYSIDGTPRQLLDLVLAPGWGAGDASLSSIDESGRIVVQAYFSDGVEGIFVVVPEPGALAWLVLSASVFRRPPRRR